MERGGRPKQLVSTLLCSDRPQSEDESNNRTNRASNSRDELRQPGARYFVGKTGDHQHLHQATHYSKEIQREEQN